MDHLRFPFWLAAWHAFDRLWRAWAAATPAVPASPPAAVLAEDQHEVVEALVASFEGSLSTSG